MRPLRQSTCVQLLTGVLCDRIHQKRQLCLLIGNDVLLRTAAEVAVVVASVDEQIVGSYVIGVRIADPSKMSGMCISALLIITAVVEPFVHSTGVICIAANIPQMQHLHLGAVCRISEWLIAVVHPLLSQRSCVVPVGAATLGWVRNQLLPISVSGMFCALFAVSICDPANI